MVAVVDLFFVVHKGWDSLPHNPAGADKSEGGIGGLWVVDWPERLLPMWLETLREQLRLHLHFLFFFSQAWRQC